MSAFDGKTTNGIWRLYVYNDIPGTLNSWSLTISSSKTYNSTDVPKTIMPPIITSTINISDTFSISDVNVTIDITHTFVGLLWIYIKSPDGTYVDLSFFNGGSGDNYTNTTFDDEASISIVDGSPPFTGSFRPEEPLSAFDGKTTNGIWRLYVYNDIPGTLNSWSLTISSPSTITVSKATDFGGGGTSPGTENVRFLQLGVQTDSGTATISEVKAKFTSASSAINSDISAFDVYHDTDGDGNIDGGSSPLGTVSSPDLTNGATVTGLSFGVTTTPKYLLLVLDIASGADSSHTAGLELTDNTFITASGIAESTNFPIQNTSDTSLPVELSAFSATAGDGQVTLRWVTQTEVNNIGFAIYRSERTAGEDASSSGKYIKIAFVDGAGNSAMPRDYQFTDKKMEAGKTYFYYLEDIDIAGERSKSDVIKIIVPPAKFIPKAFRLLQNYPNPFNPETWIPFDLAADANVTIRIYDVKGQLVRQLEIGEQEAGRYLGKDKAAYWNGKDQLGQSVSSGLYFYMLKAGNFVATRRMVILK